MKALLMPKRVNRLKTVTNWIPESLFHTHSVVVRHMIDFKNADSNGLCSNLLFEILTCCKSAHFRVSVVYFVTVTIVLTCLF